MSYFMLFVLLQHVPCIPALLCIIMCLTLCQLKISTESARITGRCFTYSYDGSVNLDGFLCYNCTINIGSRYLRNVLASYNYMSVDSWHKFSEEGTSISISQTYIGKIPLPFPIHCWNLLFAMEHMVCP